MSVEELTKIISPAFTQDTIFKILNRKRDLTELKILEIIINSGASKKGDSYLSSLCRFLLKATGKGPDGKIETVTLPVIVKYFPKNVARRKTFRSPDFFKTEIDFYEKVLPEMKKIKIPDEVPLLLASYCDGKNDFLALEDLSYQGYKSPGRTEEFTRDKLLVFLKTLANFHALGLVTKEKIPEFEGIASNLPESYFADRFRQWYENFLYKSMGPHYQKAAEAVLPPKYHDKIPKLFSGDFYGKFIKCCSIRNKLCTVTEGDAWLPNFLVQVDNEGKSGAVLIDFQLARYASIVNDLIHFLYSCIPDEMLLKHWDDFIQDYHNFLTKRIEELGGHRNYITLKELNEEIQGNPLIGVLMAMESSLMAILTDEEVADLDFMQGEDAIPLEDVWLLPKFDRARNERLAFLVKHFTDQGLI